MGKRYPQWAKHWLSFPTTLALESTQMRLFCLFFALLSLAAQTRNGPPTFAPGDTEGLVVSPNPRIRHAWKRKVFWKLSPQTYTGTLGRIPRQTPAESQQLTATLNALVALLKATPTGSNGEGFWVKDSRTLGYSEHRDLPANVSPATAPLVFETGIYPFYHEDVFDKGKWELSLAGETASVYYYFNQLPGALGRDVIAEEDRGPNLNPVRFYLRPELTGRLGAFPIYANRELVIARPGREIWAPAPLGQVLKAALPKLVQQRKTAEDRLASYKKKAEEIQSPAWEKDFRDRFEKSYGALKTTKPSSYQTRFASMERELAYTREKAAAEANPQRNAAGNWYWNPIDSFAEAEKLLPSLTPAQAAQPACFLEYKTPAEKDGRYQLAGSIQPLGTNPACREIVQTNWQYFDPKLPRTAVQILTIRDFGRCATIQGNQIVSAPITRWDAPPQGCAPHAQMWRELDWSKLAALLAP